MSPQIKVAVALTAPGFSQFHRIKKCTGATAVQTLVVVTTHINHFFLFIASQEL